MTITPITGGCLCGGVRYEYNADIGPASICHCEDCRRVTGSAFNVSILIQSEHFQLTAGELKKFVKIGDSGGEITRCFCPDCGSPIIGYWPHRSEISFLKAGSLDDPSLVLPGHQSWTQSAVSWAHIPSDLPAFEKGRR